MASCVLREGSTGDTRKKQIEKAARGSGRLLSNKYNGGNIKDYIEFLACIFAIRVPDDLLYSASEIA